MSLRTVARPNYNKEVWGSKEKDGEDDSCSLPCPETYRRAKNLLYPDQIDNSYWSHDNCRGWQVMLAWCPRRLPALRASAPRVRHDSNLKMMHFKFQLCYFGSASSP
jgi:hypothetical protein